MEAEPAVHDFETDLIGENATLGGALETEETSTLRLEPPAIAEENCAPSFVEFESPAIAEENFAPSFVEPTFSANEELPVVTAEVLAIEREELDSSPIAQYVEPDLLDAPLFIAPNSELAADNVIDEVDAAFITAGLRATGAGSPSNDALQAAAALEEVARRLRAGDIDLRRAPTASLSSEESALATVLAALLANR